MNLAGFGQSVSDGAGFLHGTRDQPRSVVDGRYQVTQRFDRVVDGISDGAGDIFSDAGLYGQITFGEVTEFVEQAQDRILVTTVLVLGVLFALLGFQQTLSAFPILQVDQYQQQDEGENTEQVGDLIIQVDAEQAELTAALVVGVKQLGARFQ